MPIFNNFTDTIFLKEDSELEKKVEALKKFKADLKQKGLELEEDSKDKLEQDLLVSNFGLIGEKRVAFELKNANIGMYVLHDINLEYENLKAQIDFIIVTRSNCYVVECKNMVGSITVNQEGEFRREFITPDGRKIKKSIYSPYTQAKRHIDIMKKIWLKKNGKISRMIAEKEFDSHHKPLIIMANPEGALNIRYAPKEIKEVTIKADQLIDYLKKDLNNFDKTKYLLDNILNTNYEKKEDLYNQANNLLKYHKEKDEDYTKEYKIKAKNKDGELREKLKEFRKEKAMKFHKRYDSIFSNDELEKLVELKPKRQKDVYDILQSKESANYYSKEIVKIINEMK